MKNRKVLHVFLVLLIISISLMTTTIGIVECAGFSWDATINDLDNGKTSNASTSASNIMKSLITIVRIVATGVAIIMIIFVAMKYMTSAPGERAEIKKHAVPFVVGAIVLFASSGILSIIQTFASENIK